MSVKTYTDSTTRIITKTIEEHVWEIRCDVIDPMSGGVK